MVASGSGKLSLGEAATRFLAHLPPEVQETSQPEVYRFVRWFGTERPLAELTAPEVANYAERLSLSDTDYAQKLELTRAFLAYVKKQGWSPTNLATHLKAKKAKTGLPSSARGLSQVVALTRQGHEELMRELEALKSKRPKLIEEIRQAAADKDFRENVPLHAAREQLGHLEGRIIELEETLKFAKIIGEETKSAAKVDIGDTLILMELNSREELRYTIVPPREVDPAQGKISSVSPIGKALLGRSEGEIVEVAVPAGKLRYQIKRIEP